MTGMKERMNLRIDKKKGRKDEWQDEWIKERKEGRRKWWITERWYDKKKERINERKDKLLNDDMIKGK